MRGPPVSRPAACGGRDPGDRSRGRARCFARGGKSAESRAVSVSQRPRCRASKTQSPERHPRSEPLEKFRLQPASGRCGVSPLEWGGRDVGSTAGKDVSPILAGLNQRCSAHKFIGSRDTSDCQMNQAFAGRSCFAAYATTATVIAIKICASSWS